MRIIPRARYWKNSIKRATREYNTYITYTLTFNYYYFPPGNRPAHAHIKGGWPGPDTIHNGGHIQKKKLRHECQSLSHAL